MRSNYEGPALILGLFAERMAGQGRGTLVGVSSVAGDRGRATNYVYGSAKAGFTAFLSGLRNRLARQGVHVVTVKPGFVATRMTEGMDLPGAADRRTRGGRRGRPPRRDAPPRRGLRPPDLVAADGRDPRHPRAGVQEDEALIGA